MNKKWFGVKYKNGKVLTMYDIWDNVKPLVNNVSGVLYKSFPTEKHALAWVQNISIKERDIHTPFEKDRLYIFTDGSFINKKNRIGWGFVAIKNNFVIHKESGEVFNNFESRNITGEVEAVINALTWYSTQNFTIPTSIVYDYIGLGMWANNLWKTNSTVSIRYAAIVQPLQKKYNFIWEKVSGHTGIIGNEIADMLAKNELKEII